jgi:hypothetical protein
MTEHVMIAYDLLDYTWADVAERMTMQAANGLTVHSWKIYDNRCVVLYERVRGDVFREGEAQ